MDAFHKMTNMFMVHCSFSFCALSFCALSFCAFSFSNAAHVSFLILHASGESETPDTGLIEYAKISTIVQYVDQFSYDLPSARIIFVGIPKCTIIRRINIHRRVISPATKFRSLHARSICENCLSKRHLVGRVIHEATRILNTWEYINSIGNAVSKSNVTCAILRNTAYHRFPTTPGLASTACVTTIDS